MISYSSSSGVFLGKRRSVPGPLNPKAKIDLLRIRESAIFSEVIDPAGSSAQVV